MRDGDLVVAEGKQKGDAVVIKGKQKDDVCGLSIDRILNYFSWIVHIEENIYASLDL